MAKEEWQADEGPMVHQPSRTPWDGNVAVHHVWGLDEVGVSACEEESLVVEVEVQG